MRERISRAAHMMPRRVRLTATAGMLFLFVALTIGQTHSRYLFSWDSANYAFAISRIDISLHRPHPPGYLGYVFAARWLATVIHDPNAALIAWNVLALSAAGVLTAWLAETAGAGASGALAASALLVTGPLVWFYASVAEIYVSELFLTLAIACAARAALNDNVRALYWCAVALAGAAVFKLSAMVLMLPLAGYAWSRAPSDARIRAALLFVALSAMVVAVFVSIQPHFLRVVWEQFISATAGSRLIGRTSDVGAGRAVNRNVRDTVTAALAALGLVNAGSLLWWLVTDRRLPSTLDRRFVAFWALPWFAEFVFIHIAKPGYVLPLVPLGCIVLGNFYARRGVRLLAGAVALQAVANAVYIGLLAPPTASGEAHVQRYRDKTFLQQMASDLQPLTFPTRATILAADDRVDALLKLRHDACPSGEWIVVAGVEPIDWRRAMYYLPSAQAIHVLADRHPAFIGKNGDFTEVPETGAPIASDCGLLWIGDENPNGDLAALWQRVDHLGWLLPSGFGRVTRDTITWRSQ